jgi:hypothetical protein
VFKTGVEDTGTTRKLDFHLIAGDELSEVLFMGEFPPFVFEIKVAEFLLQFLSLEFVYALAYALAC